MFPPVTPCEICVFFSARVPQFCWFSTRGTADITELCPTCNIYTGGAGQGVEEEEEEEEEDSHL